VSLHRALIDLEGRRFGFRIIVSEIHRIDGSIRYAYYVLDSENRLVQGFDNSPDVTAIKQRYGVDWKSHIHDEVPHQHDANHSLALTQDVITFEMFIEWLNSNLA
jgi:hypothetical protein